ncbi:MAG TPA: NTF2 fold immunity protein [Chthoniobacterales bacterium]|nr:NTF2 fold immunity protein [Chthoniobacterales bacterium]
MRRAILGLGLICVIVFADQLFAATHLNQWTAMNIGLAALKAKYPNEYRDLIIKYRPFVAKFEDGVWHVHGKTGIFVLGGGAPAIEIRDRDEKVLRIYFAK